MQVRLLSPVHGEPGIKTFQVRSLNTWGLAPWRNQVDAADSKPVQCRFESCGSHMAEAIHGDRGVAVT